MSSRHGVILGLGLLVALTTTGPAWATPADLASFKQAYPMVTPVSCQLCHQNAIGKKGDLNAYGLALQKLKIPADAKKLTVDDYRAIEKQDSDGDGISNLDEIKAGTGPGKPGAAKTSKRLKTSAALQAYLGQFLEPSSAWAEEPKAGGESAKAEYVGSETCAGCHAKQAEEFKHSSHVRIDVPGAKVSGCETCHGPGSKHAEAGGGRGVGGIINPRKDPSACFTCHLDKKAEFRLTFHHPVLEGKMGCADCHSAHGAEVRPWSATTMQDINEACYKCHKDQRGPFVWEHEALREGCATCHKVHGSINDKMLSIRDSNLCLRCHAQVGLPTVGKRSHASYWPSGTCFSGGCHTAVHGSNFDAHLRY